MKTYFFASVMLVLGLTTSTIAAPVQWSAADGGNDHWYEIVRPNMGRINWTTANSLAQSSSHLGQTGYLASITSAGEQSFLNMLNAAFTAASSSHHKTYVRAWLGGTDAATEGTWEWTSGESFSYENWNRDVTVNGGPRDYTAGWWNRIEDKWKDCRHNKYRCKVFKYVVEYDAPPVSPVPIPASLPLILGGVGALAFFGRRRRKS